MSNAKVLFPFFLVLTVPIEKAPTRAAYVEIDFEAGIPVGINGKKMDGVRIIEYLNALGGRQRSERHRRCQPEQHQLRPARQRLL